VFVVLPIAHSVDWTTLVHVPHIHPHIQLPGLPHPSIPHIAIPKISH